MSKGKETQNQDQLSSPVFGSCTRWPLLNIPGVYIIMIIVVFIIIINMSENISFYQMDLW